MGRVAPTEFLVALFTARDPTRAISCACWVSVHHCCGCFALFLHIANSAAHFVALRTLARYGGACAYSRTLVVKCLYTSFAKLLTVSTAVTSHLRITPNSSQLVIPDAIGWKLISATSGSHYVASGIRDTWEHFVGPCENSELNGRT